MKGLFSKYFEFFRREKEKLIVFLALFLVGVVSFEAGFLAGGSTGSLPLVIEKPAITKAPEQWQVAGVSGEAKRTATVSVAAAPSGKDCAFVGSRNSTLYHLPTCASAKRIKPENIVCFVSTEDAVTRGYKPGCLK
jgi:hypothetical protein